MRTLRVSLGILCSILALTLPVSPSAWAQDVHGVVLGTISSVGAILAERDDGTAAGTAFVASDRLVLTAYHVVEGARRIRIKFPDYPPLDAEEVTHDTTNDLAVLSIPSVSASPLPLGDFAKVQVGQRIVVIGFPRIDVLGVQTPTVTEGIVSAIRPGVLQMQAPISPGSSGGPLLNLQGEVIGVVRATLRGEQQGINFATTISAAKTLLASAIAGQSFSWLKLPSAPVVNQTFPVVERERTAR